MSMIRPAGVVHLDGVRPWCMSDREAEQMLSTARELDIAGAITRPSGDPETKRQGRVSSTPWAGRQAAAAYELARLWRCALPIRGFPKGYQGALSSRPELGDGERVDAQAAWDGYCAAMEEVERRCSARHARMLRTVIVYEEPTRLDTAWLVREALDYLADWWGIK